MVSTDLAQQIKFALHRHRKLFVIYFSAQYFFFVNFRNAFCCCFK